MPWPPMSGRLTCFSKWSKATLVRGREARQVSLSQAFRPVAPPAHSRVGSRLEDLPRRANLKAFILLAEHATTHPDGTFSVLRAGIDRVTVAAGQAATLTGSMIIRISASLTEVGEHEFAIRVLTDRGQRVAPDITGTFTVPEGGGVAQPIAAFALKFPGHGRYSFVVLVDKHELDTWTVEVVPPPPTEGDTK